MHKIQFSKCVLTLNNIVKRKVEELKIPELQTFSQKSKDFNGNHASKVGLFF